MNNNKDMDLWSRNTPPQTIIYKNGKGQMTTRSINNIEVIWGLYNAKYQYVIRATCCKTNKNLIIPLQGVKFED